MKVFKNIHVFCPGFSSDCLETIDEIGRESKEEFLNMEANPLSLFHV